MLHFTSILLGVKFEAAWGEIASPPGRTDAVLPNPLPVNHG